MTLEELRAEVDAGAVDTVLLAMTDMQGRLQGKRLTARHFLDEVAEHGAEGCNYLLARRRRHGDRRGLRDGLVGARLRRLRAAARPGDAAPRAVARGDRDVPRRRRLGRRLGRRRARRARSCAASSRGWPSAAGARTPAPSSSSSSFATRYEQAWEKGYRELEPANLYNVDYSLLGTARVEPLMRRIRNSMEGAGMRGRGLQGGVQLRPARDQLPLRRRAADRRRARDLQERRQGDRRARGAWRSRSWRSTTSARATRATSTSRSPTRTVRCSRASRRLFESFLAGQLAALRELTLLLAPNVNSYKRYAAGDVRADRGRLGPRQPHVRAARRRPRAVAALREPRRRRRPEPLPGAQRDDRRRPARRRARAGARAGVRGQRLRRAGQAAPAGDAARRARGLFAAERDRARGVRRRGRRALRQRRRRRARGVRNGASPTGSGIRGFERL